MGMWDEVPGAVLQAEPEEVRLWDRSQSVFPPRTGCFGAVSAACSQLLRGFAARRDARRTRAPPAGCLPGPKSLLGDSGGCRPVPSSQLEA